MTWTNAFDVGECTVRVLSNGSTAYSGVLAKGASSGNFADPDSSATLSVDVSAEGIVTLNLVSGELGSWKRVDVIPSYDISSTDIRASSISMDSYFVSGFAGSADSNPDFIPLTTSDGGAHWTPDPVDVSSLTPREGILVGGLTT